MSDEELKNDLSDYFGFDYQDFKNDSVQSKEMFDIEIEPKVDIHIGEISWNISQMGRSRPYNPDYGTI